MNTILNLTQHAATTEQKDLGVMDLNRPGDLEKLKELLTFNEVPSRDDIISRATEIAAIASSYEGVSEAMIGGAPYLMGALEEALRAEGITPMYAFTRRETVEVTNPDGSVTKTAVFKHAGWVR